jgi:Amt family ammonium transporter
MTEVYILLPFLISGFIYPITLSWVKGDGWLSRLGFHESGLGSPVLLVGATTGFIFNMFLGSRFGRFYQQRDQQ